MIAPRRSLYDKEVAWRLARNTRSMLKLMSKKADAFRAEMDSRRFGTLEVVMGPDYEANVRTFAVAAAEFCELLERVAESEPSAFMSQLDRMLPLLYFHGRSMAVSAPDRVFDIVADGAEEIELGGSFTGIAATTEDDLAKRINYHLGVLEADHITVIGSGQRLDQAELKALDWYHSVGNRLARMYKPIRDGLSSFEAGDTKGAGRDWLFSFYAAWGGLIPHLLEETFRLTHATISGEESSIQL